MGPMTEATCPTCREPRVPLIRCATCDAMACELCLFTPDLICLRCNQRDLTATKEDSSMTIADAMTVVRALYPGKHVIVTVQAQWNPVTESLTPYAHVYVHGIGNLAYGAPSLAAAVAEARDKAPVVGHADLLTDDAQLAAMTEPAHVA